MSETKELPQWAAALGRVPSGLFVVTARGPLGETGMLGSWVQQCSFDPPQLTVAVRKGRFVLEWLTEGAAFAVNVIPEGQKALVAHFGKGFELGQPAFDGVEYTRHGDSAPLLATALACLDCRVVTRLDAGDHVLVLGRVVGGTVNQDGKPALHVRKNGLHY
jgi:flavin reductase (DIM6/NTAB) family NADH-FMN oxidoreductase RutF